jgi:zona occludens toxin
VPINVYTGLMRSGKSYEVVSQVILEAIAQGRRVVTNVDGIDSELVRAYVADKRKLPMEQLGQIAHVTNEDVFKPDFLPYYDDAKTAHTDTIVQPGDLVAIDEAWRFWGTDCKLLKQHKSFFLEHGHFTHPESGVACDLVLMIQDMGTLHRFLKNVVAFSFRTHKKISFGLNNTYSVVMWEGSKMNKQTRIGDWVRRYNKEIFPLYSSFKGGAQGKTVNVDKRQNIFANPRLWVVVGLCLFGGIYGFRNLWKFFHPAPPPADIAKSGDAGSPKGAAPVTPGAAAPVADSALGHPGLSSQWRIAGRYAHGPDSWVLLVDSAGQVRMESPSVITGTGLLAVGVIDGQLVTPYSGGSITEFKGPK